MMACHWLPTSLEQAKFIALYLVLLTPFHLMGQSRDGIRYKDLKFEPLSFAQPRADVHEITRKVKVLFLQDTSLPLVSIFARFHGGTIHFNREQQGVVTAVPMLLRSGGSEQITPDSINTLLEQYATNLSFGRDGRSSFSSLNTLTEYLDESLEIWNLLLTQPGFSSEMIHVWRNQELDYLRRSERDPNTIAIRTFNQLMFGDHPTGWTLRPEDLDLEDLNLKNLSDIHRKIFCRDNLTLGVTGNTTWSHILPKLNKFVESIPPCESTFTEVLPIPIPAKPGIYVVRNELPQTTIIIGKHSKVKLDDNAEYFAAQVGNLILGGSGLNSRLSSRIRTESGLSYSASSIWTAPTKPPGVLAAMTQTKNSSTGTVIKLIDQTLQELSENPPHSEEVQDAIDEISNGFVFNFQSPAQIVSRQMFYLTQNLPLNWLSTYLEGIQRTNAQDIHNIFRENLARNGLEDMVTVVVGNHDLLESELNKIGTVYAIEPN